MTLFTVVLARSSAIQERVFGSSSLYYRIGTRSIHAGSHQYTYKHLKALSHKACNTCCTMTYLFFLTEGGTRAYREACTQRQEQQDQGTRLGRRPH